METTWIGYKGDRVEVSAEVTQEKVYDTKWGITHVIQMSSPTGALVLWRASRAINVRVGDPITIRATVCTHRRIGDDMYIEVGNGRVLEGALGLF
jgi:hypothetical protein